MTDTPNEALSHPIRHRRLKQASWIAVILALGGFPAALFLYALATLSCLVGSESTGLCDLFRAVPWIGALVALALYLFALWLVHEMGHEELPAPGRLRLRNARHGYLLLRPGHHRLLRRLHRVSAAALAMMAAWVAFMFMETDTGGTLAAGLIAYLIAAYFNWRTYPRMMEKEFAAASREDETRNKARSLRMNR